MNSKTTAVAERAGEMELDVTAEAAEIVDQMTDDLSLWETQVDAGLFLAGLAAARGEEPIPAGDRGPAEVTLGPLADSEAEDLDHLAILGVLDGEAQDLAGTLAEDLSGWVEAGARLLGPRLEGADAVEATAEIVEIARDVS